jgi:hypothetical protein
MGNPGALQAKVQQEQKGNPGLPPDLRDLLALQDIQTQKDAYTRQMAMTPPQTTVADQLIQAVKQPLPGQQGMPQMPQGMPQGAPQGLPQGLPQGMAPSMPPAQQPGLQQLPSNIGQHLSGGGIVAFADGQDVISERDQLRHMEAAYNPAVTEALNKANTTTDYMPAEVLAAARQGLARGVMLNPEQERAAEERRHEARVGNRDTSQYDRLMAEYESRKKQLEGPKPGIDALLEYLGQVAATPRGKTWMESGSMAARAQNDMAAQRQAQQFELTKLGIDAAQKKADILYGDKEKLFGLGNAAYDRAFKTNFDAAKLVTSNAFEAEKLAKQMTDNQLQRENQLLMEREREKGANARHTVPVENQVYAGYLKANNNDPQKAYEAMKMAAVAGKNAMTRDQAADNVRKDLESIQTRSRLVGEAEATLKASGISQPTMQQVQEYLIQKQMQGISLTPPPQPNSALFNRADAILSGSK